MSEKIQPKVRFSGFTDAWEQRKLGDVVDWSRGEGLSKKYLNTKKNGIPAIHYADLYKFGPIMRQTLHFANSHTGKVLKEGDLLFPMSDVTPKGLARVVSVITNGILAGGDILIASPQKDFGSFLSYEINKNKGQILRYVTGTTIRHINANSLSKLIVHGTKKAEELEISKLLISIDSLIAANQSKLEELKTVKKLAMQKIFDQKWRFKGFTDPWEQRKLTEIVNRVNKSSNSDVLPKVEFEDIV
ncbi:restriction endonuclease subunit S, partial [Pediococcus ethanolidurans]|uniref:restriction endonuclease subunit S n=1 Tax=Pediococcus ethanolidurans TaxID=319653 RepID=UPI0021AA0AF3